MKHYIKFSLVIIVFNIFPHPSEEKYHMEYKEKLENEYPLKTAENKHKIKDILKFQKSLTTEKISELIKSVVTRDTTCSKNIKISNSKKYDSKIFKIENIIGDRKLEYQFVNDPDYPMFSGIYQCIYNYKKNNIFCESEHTRLKDGSSSTLKYKEDKNHQLYESSLTISLDKNKKATNFKLLSYKAGKKKGKRSKRIPFQNKPIDSESIFCVKGTKPIINKKKISKKMIKQFHKPEELFSAEYSEFVNEVYKNLKGSKKTKKVNGAIKFQETLTTKKLKKIISDVVLADPKCSGKLKLESINDKSIDSKYFTLAVKNSKSKGNYLFKSDPHYNAHIGGYYQCIYKPIKLKIECTSLVYRDKKSNDSLFGASRDGVKNIYKKLVISLDKNKSAKKFSASSSIVTKDGKLDFLGDETISCSIEDGAVEIIANLRKHLFNNTNKRTNRNHIYNGSQDKSIQSDEGLIYINRSSVSR